MAHGFKSHHWVFFFSLPPTTPTSPPSCEWVPGVSWGGSFLLNSSGPGGTSGAHTTCCEKVAGLPAIPSTFSRSLPDLQYVCMYATSSVCTYVCTVHECLSNYYVHVSSWLTCQQYSHNQLGWLPMTSRLVSFCSNIWKLLPRRTYVYYMHAYSLFMHMYLHICTSCTASADLQLS